MPPKRASNKKQSNKATSSAEAEILNNGVKELAEAISTGSKSFTNSSAEALEEDPPKELEKAKTIKRSGGRAKNSAPTDIAVPPSVDEKPATKGKGRKKKEIEVIQNENEAKQEIKTEVVEEKIVEEEITTKPKGRGSRKKSKVVAKKTKASKEIEKTESAGEIAQEEQIDDSTVLENVKKSTSKVVGKPKKHQGVTNNGVENIEVKKEDLYEPLIEKANKKSPRGTKKAALDTPDIEPQKKKVKSTSKVKVEEDRIEDLVNDTTITKKEKKPTKRGRNAVKQEAETENAAEANNGDFNEEVLPKKRSRKVVNGNKETVGEKPKKGRGKKPENTLDNLEEEGSSTALKEKDIATNGDLQEEQNDEVIKVSPKLNKRAAKKADSMDTEPATKARVGGRKRAAPSTNKSSRKAVEDTLDDDEDKQVEDEADINSKPSKTKKKKDTSAAPLNPTATKYNKEDFELAPLLDGETAEQPRYNLKISSWNVAGLRSWLKKEGLKFLEYEQPDIFCMQEIKCTTDQLPEEVERIPGYHPYWLCMPGGYAGVAIYSKIMPINVEYGIGNKEFDNCGRIITAEYEKFFLINVYVPNSGRKLVNLDARMKWEKVFQEFVQKLDARKPVVICGDMNVSHQEIDLANPKTNTRNAGFTKEERDKLSELLALGYIDTFRHLYPDRKGAYTYWTYMGNARARNVGWRLDYFIVSERFIKRVVDNCIRTQCMGSDHCPITLFMKL